jgi:hypothetical protein
MQQFWIKFDKFFEEHRYKIISVLIFLIIAIPGVLMPNLEQPEIQGSIGSINIGNIPETKTETIKNTINFGNFNQNDIIPEVKTAKIPLPTELPAQFNPSELQVKKDIKALEPNINSGTKGMLYSDNSDQKELSTDKFPVGSSVKIKYQDKSVITKVGSKRILASGTMGMVSQSVFQELGVDPKKITELEVNIEQL